MLLYSVEAIITSYGIYTEVNGEKKMYTDNKLWLLVKQYNYFTRTENRLACEVGW